MDRENEEKKEEIKLENLKAKDSIISAISYMRLLNEAYKKSKEHTI